MIDIRVQTSIPVKRGWRALARRAAEAALRCAGQQPIAYGLTVVLSDDAGVAALNERFANVEGPTDVLAFPAGGDALPLGKACRKPYLGDVIVSVERVRSQAQNAGHAPERELVVLVAHGTLHLLGYDHVSEAERARMWQLQEAAAAEVLGEAR